MNTPRLSVCIPTFRRAALLLETLESVAGQGDAALLERLEVLVSDNASPDDTEAAVRAFAGANPGLPLRYRRHAENIGADANMVALVEQASGEFILLLSDDDLLLPGALAKLLTDIDAHPEVDAFCLNARSFQKNPALEPKASAPVFALDADTRLPDRTACLNMFGTWLTFMSLLAFRRSALSPAGYAGRVGTNLVMGYVYLDVVERGAWVLCRPRLAVRDNFGGGFNFFEVFVTQFQELLGYAQEKGCSSRVSQRVLQRHLRRFLLLSIVTFKRRAGQNGASVDYQEGRRRLLQAYPGNPFLLGVILPLMLAPPGAVRGVYGLYRALKDRL